MRTSLGAHVALATIALGLLPASHASAADLPAIKTSPSNEVAACATPGRLMAYLKASNPKLLPKFDEIATQYMRHGEQLGVRWDYAFFQMLLETAYLKYTGDVKPDQNNFAGLGATGRGVRGESFPDVSTGVTAHLQHLLMYSGEHIDNPIAERTRNVQEWGVLTSWQKTIDGPMTFTQLAKQWAPGTRRYASDIGAVGQRFFDGICKDADPAPELVAEARGTKGVPKTDESKTETKGEQLARKALEAGREEGTPRAGLGGANAVPGTAAADAAKPAKTGDGPAPALSILNADSAPETATATNATATVGNAKATAKDTAAKVEKTALSTGTKPSAAAKSCRVWTASYGGTKAVLIKAAQAGTTNYTVLDVNDGAEERESAAYIAAYAKGGEKVADFPNPNDALDKAFELCPEG